MLRVLLRRGLTDPEIAERLGVTKGAVAGKRYRLELECNPVPRRKPGADIERILREG